MANLHDQFLDLDELERVDRQEHEKFRTQWFTMVLGLPTVFVVLLLAALVGLLVYFAQ